MTRSPVETNEKETCEENQPQTNNSFFTGCTHANIKSSIATNNTLQIYTIMAMKEYIVDPCAIINHGHEKYSMDKCE